MDRKILEEIKDRFDFESLMMQQVLITRDREIGVQIEALFSGFFCKRLGSVNDEDALQQIRQVLTNVQTQGELQRNRTSNLWEMYKTNWERRVGLLDEEKEKEIMERIEEDKKRIDKDIEEHLKTLNIS